MERTYGSYYASVFVRTAGTALIGRRELLAGADRMYPEWSRCRLLFAHRPGASSLKAIHVFTAACVLARISRRRLWFIKKVMARTAVSPRCRPFFGGGTSPAERTDWPRRRAMSGLWLPAGFPMFVPLSKGLRCSRCRCNQDRASRTRCWREWRMAKPVVLYEHGHGGNRPGDSGAALRDSGTPEQFIDAICGLWRNPERASRHSARVRANCANIPFLEATQDACESLLRNAAGRGGNPREYESSPIGIMFGRLM